MVGRASPFSLVASCGHPSPPLSDLRARVFGDGKNPGSAQALLPRRQSMFRRQAKKPRVLAGRGWEVGMRQKPVSGCPLLDTVQLCARSPQAPAALQQKAWHLARLRLPRPSFSLPPPTSSDPPGWPSKPGLRQGALKGSSVVRESQKCQAGSDWQAASPQPGPPLSWLTDPQQLWPLPPGAGGWGPTVWRSLLWKWMAGVGAGIGHRSSKLSTLTSPNSRSTDVGK